MKLALGVGAGVVVGAAVLVTIFALRPAPAASTSARIAVGQSWTSPYGVGFTYDRWQGEPREAFHILVEDTARKERQGIAVAPQGAEQMRETYGVPWHVVSFEGMTTDGSDWIQIEAKKPATTTTATK